MQIIIEEFKDFARCELPDGRPIYGTSVESISETLDLMSEAGMFVQEVNVDKEKSGFDLLSYNR